MIYGNNVGLVSLMVFATIAPVILFMRCFREV